MGSRIIAIVEDYIKITYNKKDIKDFFYRQQKTWHKSAEYTLRNTWDIIYF